MHLHVQRRIAASILGCSKKRVWLDEQRSEEIKEAITREDIRSLVNKGLIQEKPKNITSRGRARKAAAQRRKGRKKGKGKRKGVSTSRLSKKRAWIDRVRIQRRLIRNMKKRGILTTANYRKLFLLIKGGFFRSKRHIKLYMDEHSLAAAGAQDTKQEKADKKSEKYGEGIENKKEGAHPDRRGV